MYKYIQKMGTLLRNVPPSSQASLRPLPISKEAWHSISMDFIIGILPDEKNPTGVLVFADRFSKMVHFAPVSAHIRADATAELCDIVHVVELIPSTRRIAINNAVDASTGLTTFFVSTARPPRVSAHLAFKDSPHTSSTLGGGVSADGIAPEHLMIDYVVDKVAHDASHAVNFVANGISSPDTMHPVTPSLANFAPTELTSPISSAAVTDLILLRQGITRFVRDAFQQAVDMQKENEAKRGRKHLSKFNEGDRALFFDK
ncbi:unnamed protein product [Peronospora belbahrii]|uniref:Uncharacterized protein n=1 Tax=Peronospora belbahrii TaxID=622444 RepID=A0AAU9LAX7_9STRA|nr:unnamed protein product [Peronospora belbahrii]